MSSSWNDVISWLWPVIDIAGAVVFVVKFWRAPLTAVLGALGFGIAFAWGVAWRVLVHWRRESGGVPELVFTGGNLLSMLGLVLVIAAIATVPARAAAGGASDAPSPAP